MIAKYFKLFGTNWEKVSQHFGSRTPVMLKNRYYAFIYKKNLLQTLSEEVEQLEAKHGKSVDEIEGLSEIEDL